MPSNDGLLTESVASALRDTSGPPWLPGLTPALVDYGLRELYRRTGLTPSQYGTTRVLTCDNSVPLQIVLFPPTVTGSKVPTPWPRIEILGGGLIDRYEKAGVKLFTREEIGRAKISERLAEAVDMLRRVPTLFETVAALVRSVHVLDAGDDSYDVSFSDPSIPFSIFVSIPAGSAHAGALRVAESVLHEAMHLQLTLAEGVAPLVSESRSKYYSPWRGEYREARGVLHALFVFRVIDTFLMKLQDGRSPNEDYVDYVEGRRRQIAEQVAEIRSFQECPELTPLGTDFVGHLLK